MINIKKIIAAAVSLVLSAAAMPSSALCAETHNVTIVDFNGNVLKTLDVPHGAPVDFSDIDVSKLNYHINEYTEIRFNGWNTYPVSVTQDMVIYALFIRMNIQCISVPDKTEYYSDKGDIRTDGLNVTITKYTQLPQKDENGAFITKKETIDITKTCTAKPSTLEEAFANGDNSQVEIIPPGSSRPIVKYDITHFKGLGDVNSDSSVDSSDASEILDVYAQSSTGTELNLTQSRFLIYDINRDDSIDASDSSKVLDFYAKSATSDVEITWDDILK